MDQSRKAVSDVDPFYRELTLVRHRLPLTDRHIRQYYHAGERHYFLTTSSNFEGSIGNWTFRGARTLSSSSEMSRPSRSVDTHPTAFDPGWINWKWFRKNRSGPDDDLLRSGNVILRSRNDIARSKKCYARPRISPSSSRI